jgi:hypothetical protein
LAAIRSEFQNDNQCNILAEVILQTILDCSPPNEAFYVKCGYEKAGSEMHHYYDEEAVKHGV